MLDTMLAAPSVSIKVPLDDMLRLYDLFHPTPFPDALASDHTRLIIAFAQSLDSVDAQISTGKHTFHGTRLCLVPADRGPQCNAIRLARA